MGAPGVTAGHFASWDVDEAQQCDGWIVWPILGHLDLTNCPKACKGKRANLGGVFRPFGDLMGGPCGHGRGILPSGTYMRPNNAVDGLFDQFWAVTTLL